jgi:hypothetical protein
MSVFEHETNLNEMGTDKVETVSYLAIFSGVTYSNFILQLSD